MPRPIGDQFPDYLCHQDEIMTEAHYCGSCGFRTAVGSGYCGACGASQTPQVITATIADKTSPFLYATFGSRLVAGIIDWVVIWIVTIALAIGVTSAEAATEVDYPGYPFLLLPFAYHFIATAVWGRTFGKSVFGLCVISEAGTKSRIRQAFIRETIGKLVSTIVLYIGFIWAAFDRDNMTWHDHMAGTRVVYAAR